MRSRRLPGSREPARAVPEKRPATTLFDGETIPPPKRDVEVPPEPAAEPATFRMAMGVRSLLGGLIFVQVAGALWMSPRLIPALEYLSLHTSNLAPLAAILALAVGLLGWGWWFRSRKAAIGFGLASVVWWALFFGPSL